MLLAEDVSTTGTVGLPVLLLAWACIFAFIIIMVGRIVHLWKRGKALGKAYTKSLFAWLQIIAFCGSFAIWFLPWLNIPLAQNVNSSLADYGIHGAVTDHYNLLEITLLSDSDSEIYRDFLYNGVDLQLNIIIISLLMIFTISFIFHLIQFFACQHYPPKGIISLVVALICSVLFFAYVSHANSILRESTYGLLGDSFMSASIGPYLFIALPIATTVFALLNLHFRKITDILVPNAKTSTVSLGTNPTVISVENGMLQGSFCWHCGSKVGELKKFCPDCGTPTAERETHTAPADATVNSNFCPDCGTKLFPADIYCPGCGRLFKKTADAT